MSDPLGLDQNDSNVLVRALNYLGSPVTITTPGAAGFQAGGAPSLPALPTTGAGTGVPGAGAASGAPAGSGGAPKGGGLAGDLGVVSKAIGHLTGQSSPSAATGPLGLSDQDAFETFMSSNFSTLPPAQQRELMEQLFGPSSTGDVMSGAVPGVGAQHVGAAGDAGSTVEAGQAGYGATYSGAEAGGTSAGAGAGVGSSLGSALQVLGALYGLYNAGTGIYERAQGHQGAGEQAAHAAVDLGGAVLGGSPGGGVLSGPLTSLSHMALNSAFNSPWRQFAGNLRNTLQLESNSLGDLAQAIRGAQNRGQLQDAVTMFRNAVGHRVGGYGEGAGPLDIPDLPGASSGRTFAAPGAEAARHQGGLNADFTPLTDLFRRAVQERYAALPAGEARGLPTAAQYPQFGQVGQYMTPEHRVAWVARNRDYGPHGTGPGVASYWNPATYQFEVDPQEQAQAALEAAEWERSQRALGGPIDLGSASP